MEAHKSYEIIASDITRLELIRPLWEQLNDLNKALHSKYFGEELHHTWEDKDLELRRRSEQSLLKFDLAKIRDAIIGYCISTINERAQGEIVSLFVGADYRGRGVGGCLMSEHVKWLRAHNVKSLFLYVHPCNVDAIRFYWRFRFFSSSPLMEQCVPELLW
jgi:diamine N-acetyltransferase